MVAKIPIKVEDDIEILDLMYSSPPDTTESVYTDHGTGADNGKCRRRSWRWH